MGSRAPTILGPCRCPSWIQITFVILGSLWNVMAYGNDAHRVHTSPVVKNTINVTISIVWCNHQHIPSKVYIDKKSINRVHVNSNKQNSSFTQIYLHIKHTKHDMSESPCCWFSNTKHSALILSQAGVWHWPDQRQQHLDLKEPNLFNACLYRYDNRWPCCDVKTTWIELTPSHKYILEGFLEDD